MFSDLCVPLDYEQLPEIWRLRKLLTDAGKAALHADSRPGNSKLIESTASFLFHRLFVTLGYLAKSTNQPGLLTETGAMQFRSSLEPLFGDNCDPVKMAEDAGFIRSNPAGEGWVCPLFARLNLHLSGDYKPGHTKGNVNSRLSAAMKNIPGESLQQIKLLGDDIFKSREGVQLTEPQRQAATVVIRTLDRCLMRERKSSDYSTALIASAHEVATAHDREGLRNFYYWLANNFEKPEIPKTADEILREFEKYFVLAKDSAPAL